MKLVLSLLRENARLKENFKKYKANRRIEVDREISKLWRWGPIIGGTGLVIGIIGGRGL